MITALICMLFVCWPSLECKAAALAGQMLRRDFVPRTSRKSLVTPDCCWQVLQRRMRRVIEDVRQAAGADVDRLAVQVRPAATCLSP